LAGVHAVRYRVYETRAWCQTLECWLLGT
jgi:hypothetical protein